MPTLVHVILSGSAPGILSRDQFMPAYSGSSLFQLCIERNASFADRLLTIGHNDYYIRARDYFKSIGNKAYLNIIEEDHYTNVYSIAFAAFSAEAEEILLITPSYYLISDGQAYKESVEKMIRIAEEGQIGVLSFHPEQVINNMSFITCEEDKLISFEASTEDQEGAIGRKHLVHSGILCCKAGVYLKELKVWAPDVYKVAKNAWESRVAQYVAIDTNLKIPQATIEKTLLTISAKVKVVVQTASKLHVPVKNNNGQTTDNENPHSETKGNNRGLNMIGLAL
jgi:mannose-1-phosphate guanylyltransferase